MVLLASVQVFRAINPAVSAAMIGCPWPPATACLAQAAAPETESPGDAVRIITFRPQQFTKRGKQPVNRTEKTFNAF